MRRVLSWRLSRVTLSVTTIAVMMVMAAAQAPLAFGAGHPPYPTHEISPTFHACGVFPHSRGVGKTQTHPPTRWRLPCRTRLRQSGLRQWPSAA